METRINDGFDPEQGRRTTGAPQWTPGDDDEVRARSDDLGDRFPDTREGEPVVVEQGAVQVAGEQHRTSLTADRHQGCLTRPRAQAAAR